MAWLYPILLGLLAAPLGAALGVAVVYVVLWVRGVTEDQGRRGLMAGTLGLVPGAILGFIGGHTWASWLRDGGGGPWREFLAGLGLAVLGALAAGTVGLIAGIRWAEARGISNYAGERGAWGLFHVALPAALVAGIGGFFLGRWLV